MDWLGLTAGAYPLAAILLWLLYKVPRGWVDLPAWDPGLTLDGGTHRFEMEPQVKLVSYIGWV